METVVVLWADMLGFSEEEKKLGKDERCQLAADWENLIREAKRESGIRGAEVVYTDACLAHAPDTEPGLNTVIEFAQTLLSKGIRQKILVRGAIGLGRIHDDLRIGLAGGFQDVQELEQELNWIGIACTPQFQVPETFWDWDKLVCYPVPGKEGLVQLRPAVAWDVPPVEELHGLIGGRSLNERRYYNWMMINKAQTTVRFAKYIEEGRSTRRPDCAPPPAYVLG